MPRTPPLVPSPRRRAAPLSALVVACLLTGAPSLGAQGAQPARPSAPAGALIGYVVDVIGRPMEQVEVTIAGTDHTARTDVRGFWRIPNPPPGPRVVMARQIGYMPAMRELTIGSGFIDTLPLLLRRFPRTLSTVEVNAQTTMATSYANITAERLMQLRVGTGRLFTRAEILQARPQSIAELVQGVPGIMVTRGQGEITATTTRSGVGIQNIQGQACQLQFYLDNTPITNEGVATLDPQTFRSVEVYPQAVVLSGLSMRPDRCGAIVINTSYR